MAYDNILGIKNRKKFLREMEESKQRNREDNLRFVKWYALWLRGRAIKTGAGSKR